MAINEALAEYLALYHKGEVNAVTSRELECSFQMRGSELRREINALRGDGIPICSFEGGYYYAATAEELERTIRQLRSRIRSDPHRRPAPVRPFPPAPHRRPPLRPPVPQKAAKAITLPAAKRQTGPVWRFP